MLLNDWSGLGQRFSQCCILAINWLYSRVSFIGFMFNSCTVLICLCRLLSPPTLPHFRLYAIMIVAAVSVIHSFILFVSACYYFYPFIIFKKTSFHFLFLFWEQKGGINTSCMKLWEHYKYVLWSRYSKKPKWLTVQDFRMFTPKCFPNNVSMVDNNLSLWFFSIFFSSCVIDVTNLVGDKHGYNIKI